MEKENSKLHIFMLPWLAMGHLLPFLELSKRLALRNIEISFFSTPSSILRLPPIPQTLTPFLNLIPCSLPSINIGNTLELRSDDDTPLISEAYAAFEPYLMEYLSNPSRPKPSWIIYDFAALNWAPSLASRFNVKSSYFSIFSAAAIGFYSSANNCESPEELTKVPDLLPFPTTVTLRPFEARKTFPNMPKKGESKPMTGELNIIRTYWEFEAKWLDLIGEKFTPVGFLPPSFDREEESEAWGRMREWLDQREDFSVVYAAFGSEAKPTREQIGEIGLGLEGSGLPFVWVLRASSPPEGFEERTAGRGMVWKGWAPQARMLAHRAVGGFLTHGGWSSVVEGMAAGAAMVVLPMLYDQGLNARNLAENGYAVEVERDDEDGSFSGENIGRKLRMVMVEEEGEELRKKAREGKEIFGSEKLQEKYLDELVKKLSEKGEMVAEAV